MGMLICTRDAEPYREGEYVEGKTVLCSPACDITVIVHARPSKEEVLGWLDYIHYRMVWVCDRPPEIEDERVMYDKTTKRRKADYIPAIQATLRWSDRNRVWKSMPKVPVPLMISFLRENVRDINLYRLLAKSFRWCSEDMQQAAICFGVKPIADRPAFPKRKKPDTSSDFAATVGLRDGDMYQDMIFQDGKVANHLRSILAKEDLPKKMKKKKQKVMEWV